VESAKSWNLGLRYDRHFEDRLSVFAAQMLESDRFAAYLQRYNTDLGAGVLIYQWEQITWSGEGGYRYTMENRLDRSQEKYHSLRMASEVLATFNPRVSGRVWFEFLPNLTVADNWLLNADASLISTMSERLSLRLGYGIRYDHQPNPGATQTTDTVFTTSLVAQW
jgi:putative salt-induced outer membrane protein